MMKTYLRDGIAVACWVVIMFSVFLILSTFFQLYQELRYMDSIQTSPRLVIETPEEAWYRACAMFENPTERWNCNLGEKTGLDKRT